MSWENILKRGKKTIFYPQFRAALEQAIDTYESFTLPEIIPIVRELYIDKLLDENVIQPLQAAQRHASAQIQMSNKAFISKTINLIGTHKKTRKRNDKNEFIYKRIRRD